jgi:hypothetical protein
VAIGSPAAVAWGNLTARGSVPVLLIPTIIGITSLSAAADPLVPRLAGQARDPLRIGPQAVEIHLPWEGAGHVDLRFPETLSCNLGLLFIDHVRADMPPVVRVDRLPDWVIDEATGAASYELNLPNKVSFGATATPADGRVDLEFRIRNGTDAPLTGIHTQFCLVQTHSPMFSEGNLTRTFIHSDGEWLALADTTHEVMNPERGPWIVTAVGEWGMKPHTKLEGCWYVCPERGDTPIIATTSPDGDKVIGLTWDGGRGLMSNGWIPCLHNDPVWPDCPAGETVRVRGRVYLVEGGLEALWEVLQEGEGDETMR